MKFLHPDIGCVFDTECDRINTLIIENQPLFLRLLTELDDMINGNDGRCVLSEKGKELSFERSVELLTQFVPFDLNKKTLLSKICSSLEKEAAAEKPAEVNELLNHLEAFLWELSQSFRGNIGFTKVNFPSLIKAVGVELEEDYDSLGEKLFDYFELITEYERPKLFFTVNLRSYIADDELEKLLDTVLKHGYNLIMIENTEYKRLDKEKRFIVDAQLCEIQ